VATARPLASSQTRRPAARTAGTPQHRPFLASSFAATNTITRTAWTPVTNVPFLTAVLSAGLLRGRGPGVRGTSGVLPGLGTRPNQALPGSQAQAVSRFARGPVLRWSRFAGSAAERA
jgi:hypothetical protein